MPSTQVSPVKILLDLGIDLDNLSSEEDYLSALKEGAAMLQVGGGKTDGRFKIITDEVRKVRASRKEDAPSAGMKVTKGRISAQKLLNPAKLTPVKGGEGGGDLVVIKEKVVSIEKILGEQFKFQEDQAKEAAQERQDKKRKLREKLLEGGKNIWGGIKKVAGAVIKPFQSIWSKILGFIQTVILGRVLFKILEWGAKKENQEKIKNIFKFLKTWWPTLLTAYILFGTTFGRMATKLVALIIKSTISLAKLIPILIKKIAALKVGKLLKGLAALIPGGAKIKALTGLFSLGAGAFAEGGEVPGTGNKDTVPAMLTPGEFVMTKGAVQKYGVDTLEGMNAAAGGTNQPEMGLPGLGGGGGGTDSLTEQAKVKTVGSAIGDFFSGDDGRSRRMTEQDRSQELSGGGLVQYFKNGGRVDKTANSARISEIKAGKYKTQEGLTRATNELFDLGVSPRSINRWKRNQLSYHSDSIYYVDRNKSSVLPPLVDRNKSSVLPPLSGGGPMKAIEPPPSSKPKVTVIDQPTTEQVDSSEAQAPSKGNRKIPTFDPKCFRSSSKMEVLGISI